MKPLISAQELLEMQTANNTLKALIPEIRETFIVAAKIKKEKYNALIQEDFTPEQAMQIIIAGKSEIGL